MDEYSSTTLDAVFAAMADPSRRAILARLALGEARVTEVAGDFTISLNSVSKHVKMLERAGLVERTVIGRDHVLSLNAAPLEDAAAWIDHYRRFWEERLDALDAFVTSQRAARRKSTKKRGGDA
jgi:DNA-binding transcriptional ArsR family regulator